MQKTGNIRARKINRKLKKLFPEANIVLKYSNTWELLVSVILSAQCTDKKVNEVTEKLFHKYRTVDDFARAQHKTFEEEIKSTGFYKNKAKNIIAAAKMSILWACDMRPIFSAKSKAPPIIPARTAEGGAPTMKMNRITRISAK